MSLHPDCIPCIVKQSLRAARVAKINDEAIQKDVMKQVLLELENMDKYETAPQLSGKIQRIVKSFSGMDDPYKEIKEKNRGKMGE